MSDYYLTFPSLTHAYKARDLLKRQFPNARVVPTPKNLSQQGCSYSLRIGGNLQRISALLEQAGIPVVNVQSM